LGVFRLQAPFKRGFEEIYWLSGALAKLLRPTIDAD
jgi:hypothetical protein